MQFGIDEEVEVSFERDDPHYIWFPATVVEHLPQNNTYLVKHWFKKKTGEVLLQTSTVSLNRIRPSPPHNNTRHGYVMYDKVDAFYDFSWTSGVIVREFGEKTFMVSFKGANSPMVFKENKLRTQMDWVDGKWIDKFQPRRADDDASKSRLWKSADIDNASASASASASEIINSTLREIEATETKIPNKQNSSLCQTDATSSKKRRIGSSSKIDPLDDRVPKVAKNDALSASKKSKSENVIIITTSTNCETDATKTNIANKQSSYQEPNTPTSTVCQTNTASKRPSSVSYLKPRPRSRDDKVTESKKFCGLDNYTTLSLKRTGWPPKTPQASIKGNESKKGARHAEGTDDKDCTAEFNLALARDRTEIPQDDYCHQSHTKRSKTSASDHKGQVKKMDELVIKPGGSENGGPNSSPLKMSKVENLAAITTFTGCRTGATKAKEPIKRKSSQETKTQISPVEALKKPDKVLFLKSDSSSLDDKVTKRVKVPILNNCTTESLEGRGRPKRGDKSNEGAKGVEETDIKVCEIEHVLPLAQIVPDIEGAKRMQFSINEEVEVSFERDDTCSVWFPATVVKYLSATTYLVKYWVREETGEALLQNSSVTVERIRPSPPVNKRKGGYSLNDKIDAFYDFSWNSGSIVKEFGDKTFVVSFNHRNNSMVLKDTKLRTHMDWVDGRWINEFEGRGADNDAPQSRALKKSEIENTSKIINSTLRGTEATETKTTNKQNPSICQTDAAASKRLRNVSETESRSLDDKVQPKVAENNVSHSNPTKKSKTENAKVITTSTGGRSDATKTGTLQISSKEAKTPTSPVCETDAASTKLSNVSSLKPETHSQDDKPTEGKKVSRLDNNTTLFLKRTGRPPRTPQSITEGKDRKKGANTEEGTNDKECVAKVVPALAHDETEIPRDNIRHQSCSKRSKTSMDLKGQTKKADEPIIETEGENVRILNNCTTEALKRKGRPKRGDKSNGGAKAVERTDKKVCETEHVLPLAQKDMKTPQDNKEGSQAVLSDQQGQEQNSAGLDIKEIPNNSQKEQVNRSLDLLRTRSKKEIPAKSIEKTKLAVSNDKPKNLSSNERGKSSVDPSAISQYSAINDNKKSSSKTVRKTVMNSSAKALQSVFDGVSREESEDNSAAVDNRPEIGTTGADEILPFRKTVPLWDCIESMEIFKLRPQNPHFRSLESCDGDRREELAIGLMVTFVMITQKIPGLSLDMSKSSMKTSLENLVELEDNGFDVKSIRDRLNELLVKKDKHDILQNDLKEKKNQIMESKKKKAKNDEALDEINKKLNDLRAKREVVLEKELKDADIAMHQSSLDRCTKQMRIIQCDFENLATACW